MLFLTHFLGGILGGIAFSQLTQTHYLLILPFFIIGSILPDIDHPASKLGKKFKLLGWIFGHRKLFHTIFPPLVIGLPLLFINNILFHSLIFGYFVHLFLDALTIKGIKPFYPINNSIIRGWIKTGSFLEYIIMMLLLGVLLITII